MCIFLLLLLNPNFIHNATIRSVYSTFAQDMDEIFEKLKSQGQDTVDGVIQWMRDANLIGPEESSESKAVRFDGSQEGTDKVRFESFKATVEKISKEYGFNMEVIAQEVTEKASTMEAAFENLKKEGKNDVDNLVKWMKDSIWPPQEAASPAPAALDDVVTESLTNIIGAAKDAEDEARKLFEGAQNKTNIDIETFKSAVAKVAEEQKKNVDELMKSLAEQGPKLMEAMQAGASAFKDAMTKK